MFLNHSLREIIFPYFKEGKVFAQIYKFNNKKTLLPAWNYLKIKKILDHFQESVCCNSFLNKIE